MTLIAMSNVPGTPGRHLTITPECRRRPHKELVMEVTDHVEESVTELLEVYDENHDARIHVAVTIER
jgi:hypothetical protein